MKKKLKTPPVPIILTYDFNNTIIRYQVKGKAQNFDKLPDELIKCKTQHESIKQFSEFILQSPTINGNKTFHTRLEKVANFNNVFTGDDHYKKEDKNLILFIFSPSEKRLFAYYFPDYFPETKTRKKVIIQNYLRYLENL